ncbi:MAG TPA: purine-nucleoside phosphorylase [Bryobacteraceae bacterium]|nr:purine-nucleoside phosphorylase [Bryobacteraceae bacterium]
MARFIESKTSIRPKVGVVLGSGLGAFADSLIHATRIPYSDIPEFPVSTAIGHAGQFVIGTQGANGKAAVDVAVMSGRFHLYEGYSAQQVVSGIRLFHELGIRRVVLTNAAGGINPDYAEGALVLISDHINLTGTNPLVGPNDPGIGPRFPDMTEAYPAKLRLMAQKTADELGITLHEGVYAALPGPSYETPAEIRYLKAIGADLVGMSTALETIAANHAGMEVLGISCVTNQAAGLSGVKLNHAEVLEMGRRVSTTFIKLLSGLLPKLDA